MLQEKLDIAIPQITYKYIGPANYPIPFHGYKKLSGTPLHTPSLSRQEKTNNIEAFALFLSQLHRVPVQEIVEAGVGLQVFDRTCKANIIAHLHKRLSLCTLSTRLAPYASRILTLCKMVENIRLDQKQQVLVHGDLYCKHLLFKNKRLHAVIDWGDVSLNHPVLDLAALYSIFPEESHDRFFSIYGTVGEDIQCYAKLLAVHSMLACLEFAHSQDDSLLMKESLQALSLLFE